MIRFEVTGATPEEFAQNAMKAWGLLAIGLQQALSVQPAPSASPPLKMVSMPISPTSGSESPSTASKADEVSEEVVDFAMELDRRGGLIRGKIDERKKVHSDKVDDLFPSETSASPETSKKELAATSTKKSSAKGPKLDDLKTRLSEVIVAATERWDQKRANAYARKLLDDLLVKKLSDLAPDSYSDFMLVSAAYLDGSAAE